MNLWYIIQTLIHDDGVLIGMPIYTRLSCVIPTRLGPSRLTGVTDPPPRWWVLRGARRMRGRWSDAEDSVWSVVEAIEGSSPPPRAADGVRCTALRAPLQSGLLTPSLISCSGPVRGALVLFQIHFLKMILINLEIIFGFSFTNVDIFNFLKFEN